MTDLRYIAERWISEYGADTPATVRDWASQLASAPVSAKLLTEIADLAEDLLKTRDDLRNAAQRPR